MDEIMADFLGLSPMTSEQRDAKEQELIGQIEIDHVIKDGKVFLDADKLVDVFQNTSKMLVLRSILVKDAQSLLVAEGMSLAGDVISSVNAEMLKREVEKSFYLD